MLVQHSSMLMVLLLFVSLFPLTAFAAQPVTTGVSIPDVSMKIDDMVTVTITVLSDSAVFKLISGEIGGYPLDPDEFSKVNDTTYTTIFWINEGGNDYAAGDDIPVINLVLSSACGPSVPWNAPISQTNDPIDANRPTRPVAPDLDERSDSGRVNDDDITRENMPTFSGAAEGNSRMAVYRDENILLGTTTADADGSWSITSKLIPDGSHEITVTATDPVGSTSVPSFPLEVLIDTQAPNTPGNRNPAENTRTNPPLPELTWTAPADPGESGIHNYRIQIEGPRARDHYTDNLFYAPRLDLEGTYTWRILAYDNAGNAGEWSADWTFAVIPKPELTVHFIDVGQGDAILLNLGEIEVLIDGGGKSPGIVAYLKAHVDGPLEVMVATHPHADHIGGLIKVLDAFEVEKIWLNGDEHTTRIFKEFSDQVNAECASVRKAKRGDWITAGSLTLLVLHPANPLSTDLNENSVVLRLSYGNIDFLFTGDATKKAENSILIFTTETQTEIQTEILKVGHHGSSTSSSENFLARVQPKVAIYMAGSGYKHPHDETIRRLDEIGAEIYGTDINGTILIITDGLSYRVQTQKGQCSRRCFHR